MKRKFNRNQVFDILKSSETNKSVAAKYGVSGNAISRIRRGVTYADYGFQFRKSNIEKTSET